MAGAMRKMGEYLGLVEQADYDEIIDDEPAPAREQRTTSVVRPAPVANIEERRRPAPRAGGRDLARIETVTPRTSNDARAVGETFRAGVGRTLMGAFAKQLRGSVEMVPAEGGGMIARMTFATPEAVAPINPDDLKPSNETVRPGTLSRTSR